MAESKITESEMIRIINEAGAMGNNGKPDPKEMAEIEELFWNHDEKGNRTTYKFSVYNADGTLNEEESQKLKDEAFEAWYNYYVESKATAYYLKKAYTRLNVEDLSDNETQFLAGKDVIKDKHAASQAEALLKYVVEAEDYEAFASNGIIKPMTKVVTKSCFDSSISGKKWKSEFDVNEVLEMAAAISNIQYNAKIVERINKNCEKFCNVFDFADKVLSVKDTKWAQSSDVVSLVKCMSEEKTQEGSKKTIYGMLTEVARSAARPKTRNDNSAKTYFRDFRTNYLVNESVITTTADLDKAINGLKEYTEMEAEAVKAVEYVKTLSYSDEVKANVIKVIEAHANVKYVYNGPYLQRLERIRDIVDSFETFNGILSTTFPKEKTFETIAKDLESGDLTKQIRLLSYKAVGYLFDTKDVEKAAEIVTLLDKLQFLNKSKGNYVTKLDSKGTDYLAKVNSTLMDESNSKSWKSEIKVIIAELSRLTVADKEFEEEKEEPVEVIKEEPVEVKVLREGKKVVAPVITPEILVTSQKRVSNGKYHYVWPWGKGVKVAYVEDTFRAGHKEISSLYKDLEDLSKKVEGINFDYPDAAKGAQLSIKSKAKDMKKVLESVHSLGFKNDSSFKEQGIQTYLNKYEGEIADKYRKKGLHTKLGYYSERMQEYEAEEKLGDVLLGIVNGEVTDVKLSKEQFDRLPNDVKKLAEDGYLHVEGQLFTGDKEYTAEDKQLYRTTVEVFKAVFADLDALEKGEGPLKEDERIK